MEKNFNEIWSIITKFFQVLFLSVSISDIIDIIIVAFIIYGIIRLVRDSRAEQLLKGIFFFLIIFLLSTQTLLDLKSTNFLLSSVFNQMLIVMIVIFQPEIRRALEQLGHSSLKSLNIIGFRGSEEDELVKQWQITIKAVSDAAGMLQEQKMGALIVFERTTKLGEIAKTGTVVDAEASAQLITNMFFTNSPLHDGAMIIRDGRIYAAGCILPLSDNLSLSKDLGTRHRAAVGMSENSDSVTVVVSEETGNISIAMSGELKSNYSPEALKVALENALIWDTNEGEVENEKNGKNEKNKLAKFLARRKRK